MKSSLYYNKRWVILMSIFTVGLFSQSACKKFVQIGPPATLLVTTSVFNNSASATAAQLAIYSQMGTAGESYNIAENTGILGDELTCYSTVAAQKQFYADAMLATSNLGPWNDAYNYIYQANAVIAGLQNNGNISPSISQQLTGEAKFVRAFWYFYLTNLYGDVPLTTTTSYTVNGSISRSPQVDVYRQIITDLTEAQGVLNAAFVDASDTAITTERVRPTKGAAEALLARVYLYTQKYDSAEMASSLVIGNSLFVLCPDLSPIGGTNSVFLNNSSEAIWQLSPLVPASYNTADGQNFILKNAPGKGTSNCTAISPQLLSSFDSGDQRKVQWIHAYTKSGTPAVTYYYPYKYQSYGVPITDDPPPAGSEYVMVLRLAEQYLIRAEARAQQGNSSGAVQDLNVIRQRAGLGSYTFVDQASLLGAILRERQVELFTEWGHRWLDLIRTGSIDTVMSGVCQTKIIPSTWSSNSQLYPIPQSDRTNDANLTQNVGY